jgi:hypothetical protein
MRKSEPIEKIRKRYKKEWLLIAIDKMDKARTIPLTGRLIAHSPRRSDIYDKMVKAKSLVMPIFSDKTLPHGFAVAF